MVFLLSLIMNFAHSSTCNLQSEPSLRELVSNSYSITSIINGQRVAHQDGPNCFNATLFGKGYVSELTYVDPIEFSFYIHKFCVENSSPREPGDIVTIKHSDETYEHAALAVEGDLIFEKDSTWGKNAPVEYDIPDQSEAKRITKERADSSLYKIKKMEDSTFFGRRLENKENHDLPQVQNYKCRNARDIKLDLTSLSLIPGVQKILDLNKKIEALAFSDEPLHGWQDKLVDDISNVTKAIVKSKATGDEGLYLLTKLISLEGQMYHFTGMNKAVYDSPSKKFNEAFKKLAAAREALEEKQQENKSPLAKKVFLSR